MDWQQLHLFNSKEHQVHPVEPQGQQPEHQEAQNPGPADPVRRFMKRYGRAALAAIGLTAYCSVGEQQWQKARLEWAVDDAINDVISPRELKHFEDRIRKVERALKGSENDVVAHWKTKDDALEFVDERVTPEVRDNEAITWFPDEDKCESSRFEYGSYSVFFPERESSQKEVRLTLAEKDEFPNNLSFGEWKGEKIVVFDDNFRLPRDWYDNPIEGGFATYGDGALLLIKDEEDSPNVTFAFIPYDRWNPKVPCDERYKNNPYNFFPTTKPGLFIPPEWEKVHAPELAEAVDQLFKANAVNERVQAANDERLEEEPDKEEVQKLLKSSEFLKQMQGSMVYINSKRSNGRVSGCTASVLDDYTLLTARHCVQDGENGAMVNTVERFVPTGSQSVKRSSLLSHPAENTYHISYPEPYKREGYGWQEYLDGGDIATIVFHAPVFKNIPPLSVQSTPFLKEGKYFAPHLVGYDEKEQWKMEGGSVEELHHIAGKSHLIRFDFGSQGGNSGGPIVNFQGEIVGVQTAGDGYTSTGTFVHPTTVKKLKKKGSRILKAVSKD